MRRRDQPGKRKLRSKTGRGKFDRSLRMEVLDPRKMLSITVNTLVDELDGELVNDISLRDAIVAAPIGETIDFSVTGTINLDAGLGSLVIDKELILDGPGANLLTIDAGNHFRVIDITDTAGNVTIDGLTIAHGQTSGTGTDRGDHSFKGGGIRSLSVGMLTITESTIRDNSTNGKYVAGGGVFSRNGVKLERSTVSGNVTVGDYGYGGGIASNATVGLYLSTVSGNRTEGGLSSAGGGVYAASLIASNCTVTNNHTTMQEVGGALSTGGATINHSIIADNKALTAIKDLSYVSGQITYSLIGDNAGTTLNEAQTPDGAGNLIGSAAGSGIIDPQLEALADNGGPTFTHALLLTSPALDVGDPSAAPGVGVIPLFDQRGNNFGRVQNGRIDMGAFEVRETLSADFDGDGFISGLDFLLWQIGFGAVVVPNAVKADGDADNDRDADASDLVVWELQYGGPAPIASGPLFTTSNYFAALQGTTTESSPDDRSKLVDAAMAWWNKTTLREPASFVIEEQAVLPTTAVKIEPSPLSLIASQNDSAAPTSLAAATAGSDADGEVSRLDEGFDLEILPEL